MSLRDDSTAGTTTYELLSSAETWNADAITMFYSDATVDADDLMRAFEPATVDENWSKFSR